MEDNLKLVADLEHPIESSNPPSDSLLSENVPEPEELKQYSEIEDHNELPLESSPGHTANVLPPPTITEPPLSSAPAPAEVHPKIPEPTDSTPSTTKRPEDLLSQNFDFSVHYNTQFGEKIIVVGSTPELGNWEVSKGLTLEWSEGNIWRNTALITDDSAEFKYVCVSENSSKWEEGDNRKISAERCEVNDTWR